MELKEYKKAYEEFTSKLSDINRQSALTGIAIIWVFKETIEGKNIINTELILPSLLLVCSLISDMFQYIYQSIFYYFFFRSHEKKIDSAKNLNIRHTKQCDKLNKLRKQDEISEKSNIDIKVNNKWNYPSWFFFYLKVVLVLISYIFIIKFIIIKCIDSKYFDNIF